MVHHKYGTAVDKIVLHELLLGMTESKRTPCTTVLTLRVYISILLPSILNKGGGFGGPAGGGGGGGGYMAGGAVDSPAGGSGGPKNKDKQSILAVNIKQVPYSRYSMACVWYLSPAVACWTGPCGLMIHATGFLSRFACHQFNHRVYDVMEYGGAVTLQRANAEVFSEVVARTSTAVIG